MSRSFIYGEKRAINLPQSGSGLADEVTRRELKLVLFSIKPPRSRDVAPVTSGRVCTCMEGVLVEDCVISGARFGYIVHTDTEPRARVWHMGHRLIMCKQPLGEVSALLLAPHTDTERAQFVWIHRMN